MNRRDLVSLAVAVAAVMIISTSSFAAGVAIGDKAPDFEAVGVDGRLVNLESVKDAKVVVVNFTCNDCPVATAYEDRFIEFAKRYEAKGVKMLAINVNVSENLDMMRERAQSKGFNFPYAYDASGDSARAYGATVTPHLFILDQNRNVAYKGSFDDKMSEPSKHFAVDAVEAILAGKKPETASTKEFGCGIQLSIK